MKRLKFGKNHMSYLFHEKFRHGENQGLYLEIVNITYSVRLFTAEEFPSML